MTQENTKKREEVVKKLNNFPAFYDSAIENEESSEVYQTYMELFRSICAKKKIEYSSNTDKLLLLFIRELQETSSLNVSSLLDYETFKNEVFSNANNMSIEELSNIEYEINTIGENIRYKISSMMNERGLTRAAFDGLETNGEIFGIEEEQKNDIVREASDEEWDSLFADGNLEEYDWSFDDAEFIAPAREEQPITDEDIKEFMEFLTIIPQITKMYSNIKEVGREFKKYQRQRQLDEYMKDTEFISSLEEVMDHDRNEEEYRYHGTQSLEDGQSIIDTGLLMASSNLDRTTYSEFSMEELLLYNRGFDGLIGRDCVVIVSSPKGEDIVIPINSDEYSFSKSGLGGLNGAPEYMIPSSHIVGYVDKKNHQVIHNPNYIKQSERTL